MHKPNRFECLNLHRRKLLNHVTLQPAARYTVLALHLLHKMHVVYELRVLGLLLTLLSKLLLYHHTVKSFHLEVDSTNTTYNTQHTVDNDNTTETHFHFRENLLDLNTT